MSESGVNGLFKPRETEAAFLAKRAVLLLPALALFAFFVVADALGQGESEHAIELQRQNSPKARQALELLIPGARRSSDRVKLARLLQHLSEIDLNEAAYPQAIARSTECADLFARAGDPTGETNCRTQIGRAQAASGRYADAAASYKQALVVAHAHHLAEAEIASLNNAGSVNYFIGRYDEAFRDYTEAEALLSASTTEPWFPRRNTLTLANLAALYQRLGQSEKALQIYNRIRSSARLSRGTEEGQILENSGTLFRRLGDPYKAMRLYGEARTLFEKAHDTAGQISVAKNTGIALAFGLDQYQKATPLFRRALDLASRSANHREVAQAALYQGENMRRSGQPHAAGVLFEQALLASRKIGSDEDEWKALYGMGQLAERAGDREAALRFYRQSIDRIEHIRASAGPPALRTGFLADKRDVYDGAIRILLAQQPAPVSSIFGLLEKAKARSFQDALGRASTPLELSAIPALLPPRTLLLDYWISENHLAVVWVSNSGWGLTKGEAPDADALVQLSTRMSSGLAEDWRHISAKLSRTIIPFPKFNADRLIVIPDGILQSLPFDLLSLPGSVNGRLLIEDYSLSYLPAAALLLSKSPLTDNWSPPWQTSFEGFADPKPGEAGPAGPMFPDDSRDALSFSADEIMSAARLIGGHASLHIGAQNRKQAIFLSATHNLPVLHLATHAVADNDDPDRSRILFSPATPGAPADYLFAREIYGLNLRRVGLAVLSACDTERGVSIRGEGVQSFSRAFLAAGAHATITTLWRVGDVTGKAFSDRFYAHFANGETVEDALRATKLEFYRSTGPLAHPFYWSMYMLNGDSRMKLPRTVPWTAILALLPLLAAVWYLTGIERGGN